MDENNELYQAYLNFRQHLSDHLFPRYEEPDLLEIFDVAGDNNDIYVQSEVLFIAARLFPESSEFRQRRGFFYRRISPGALHDFIDNNPDGDGLCWDLLRLSDTEVESSDAKLILDSLLAKYDKFADEDIIRLSEVVRENDCVDWFLKNYKALGVKADYEDTVLFEAATLAHETDQNEVAVEILERLTTVDPFRAENWTLYAESLFELGRLDEAMNSVEYARAIDNDDTDVDMIEAFILIQKNKNLERAVTLLENFLEKNPFSIFALRQHSLALFMLNRNDDACEYVMEVFMRDTSNAEVLRELLQFFPSDADRLIKLHLSSISSNDTVLSYIAAGVHESIETDSFSIAQELCEMYEPLYQNGELTELYIWSLLFQEKYDRICRVADDLLNHPEHVYARDPEFYTFFALAHLKTGKLSEAKELSANGLRVLNYGIKNNITYRFALCGCEKVLTDIQNLAENADKESIDAYNLLNIRKS